MVIDQDHVLIGVHQGTIHVEAGHFELRGVQQGTLVLHEGTTALVSGRQEGTITLAPNVSVTLTGVIQGTTQVPRGSELVVEHGAQLSGTLHVDGLVIVRGVYGGARSGRGEMRCEGDGFIKQPRIENGIHFYDW